MRFLIVSRVSIPAKDRTLPCWNYLRSLGHEVVVEHPDSVPTDQRPDVLISMGVTIQDETFRALERWPGVPLYAYNWDVYEWIWKPGQGGKVQANHEIRPHEYDYVRYGELLRRASKVWVPSVCTGRRTTQWYGITSWEVIKSACPWWHYRRTPCDQCMGDGWGRKEYRAEKQANPDAVLDGCLRCDGTGKLDSVRDDGYALMCLREIPDLWWGVFERTCDEIGVPYRCTRHEVSYEEYQDAVAGCRFICAPLYELSTGGLSLMEAYYLGKPVLASDSEWNAAQEYFGERASYFRHGDIADFKRMLLRMSVTPPTQNRAECKAWIEANYSDRRMVDDMLRSIA